MNADLQREQSWRASTGLHSRCLGGDFVVFNPLSGHTHFLDIVTGHVLTLLMAGRRTEAVIRSSVATFLEVPDDDKLAATVDDILMRLQDAGLAERAD